MNRHIAIIIKSLSQIIESLEERLGSKANSCYSDKKYVLTDETISCEGRTLHRIKALKSFGDVSKGDLGGFVESEANLSHEGNCWVYDDARVSDSACVSDSAVVSSSAEIFGGARVFGYAYVCGSAEISDSAVVSGSAKIAGYAKILGGIIHG